MKFYQKNIFCKLLICIYKQPPPPRIITFCSFIYGESLHSGLVYIYLVLKQSLNFRGAYWRFRIYLFPKEYERIKIEKPYHVWWNGLEDHRNLSGSRRIISLKNYTVAEFCWNRELYTAKKQSPLHSGCLICSVLDLVGVCSSN